MDENGLREKYQGKEYNDYRNPAIWLISIIAVGCVVIAIMTIEFESMLTAGVIPATVAMVVWITLWEIYKRTGYFKKRYGHE